jgi:hypothetical protein
MNAVYQNSEFHQRRSDATRRGWNTRRAK